MVRSIDFLSSLLRLSNQNVRNLIQQQSLLPLFRLMLSSLTPSPHSNETSLNLSTNNTFHQRTLQKDAHTFHFLSLKDTILLYQLPKIEFS
jgi:hypothetical protein